MRSKGGEGDLGFRDFSGLVAMKENRAGIAALSGKRPRAISNAGAGSSAGEVVDD